MKKLIFFLSLPIVFFAVAFYVKAWQGLFYGGKINDMQIGWLVFSGFIAIIIAAFICAAMSLKN